MPKINLSFEEEGEDDAATTKKEESSGGLLGWGTSWSFGGVGAKKEEEKPKSPSFWKKSTFSDFNFGFGGGSGDPKDDSKRTDEEEDNLLPSWGTSGIGNTTKKEKKSSMFDTEEVDDTLPDSKSNGDNWGGWSSKKEDDKKPGTKSWDTWGSSTNPDKKKTSWADLDEEEEDKVDPLPAVKEDENTSWGSFNKDKAKPKKKGKAAIEDITPEPAAKEDVWGWTAKDGGDKTIGKKVAEKDDDDWGEFTATSKDKKSDDKAEGGPPPLSILKGLPVLGNGTIENLEGVVVGTLIEEDMDQAKKLFRMMFLCDEEGNIKNSKGKHVAKAKTIGASNESGPEPVAEPEAEVPAEALEPEEVDTPDISILDGLKVELDGQILDHEGNAIGELIEGDAKTINKKRFTCNTRGEFRDKKWKSVGQARVLPVLSKKTVTKTSETEEPAEEENKAAAEEPADEGKEEELPDISILKGLKLNDDGQVLNDDGIAIGKLIEGDVALILRRKYACSAEGTFLDKKLKVVGRCATLP